jgi:hypothetical protein
VAPPEPRVYRVGGWSSVIRQTMRRILVSRNHMIVPQREGLADRPDCWRSELAAVSVSAGFVPLLACYAVNPFARSLAGSIRRRISRRLRAPVLDAELTKMMIRMTVAESAPFRRRQGAK